MEVVKTSLSGNRTEYIDGIRGWAALVVVFFHAFWEIFGVYHPAFRSPLTYFILNGELAVYIFFILSGDALSLPYFHSGKKAAINKLLVKRYFRLTTPIVISCSLTYVLMKLSITYNVEASRIVHREDWLGQFIPFDASMFSLIKYSLMDVYVNHSLQNSYNPFLWTMSIEICGSMLVFLFLYVEDELKRSVYVCAAIAIFLFLCGTFYSLFFIGLLFSYLRRNGVLRRFEISRQWQVLSAFLLLGTVLLDTLLRQHGSSKYLNILISALLVACFYSNVFLRKLMCSKLSKFLGEISFPLYLVHFAVIISPTSRLIVLYGERGELTSRVIWCIALGTVIVSVLLAVLFRVVEKWILRRIEALSQHVLKGVRAPDLARS